MVQPEEHARITIDQLLAAAGWHVCDANVTNIHAARGVRAIKADNLQSVTPAAKANAHFVIVDAVGVCDQDKTDSSLLSEQAWLAAWHSNRDRAVASIINRIL